MSKEEAKNPAKNTDESNAVPAGTSDELNADQLEAVGGGATVYGTVTIRGCDTLTVNNGSNLGKIKLNHK
jgi:hypothetical protein